MLPQFSVCEEISAQDMPDKNTLCLVRHLGGTLDTSHIVKKM